jgi:endonuclease/exonuclease/phosphatase family metal-dependent hydrolase
MSFNIITYNTFPGSPLPIYGSLGIGQTNRLYKQIGELKKINYDIGCFQEILTYKTLRAYEELHKEYGIIYTHNPLSLMKILFGFLTRLLIAFCIGGTSIWTIIFFWLCHYYLHENPIVAYTSHVSNGGLLTVYKRDMFECVYSRTYELPDGDILHYIQPRICLVACLRHKKTRKEYMIVNIHINAMGPHQRRLSQIKHICSLLPNNIPIVMCGDFNADTSSDEYSILLANGWIDTADNDDPTWCSKNELTHGWLRAPDMRIDYIFVKNVLYRNYEVILKQPAVSDHYGVALEVL